MDDGERPSSAVGAKHETDPRGLRATVRPPRPFTDLVRLQKPGEVRKNWERVRAALEAKSAQSTDTAAETINKTTFDRPQKTPGFIHLVVCYVHCYYYFFFPEGLKNRKISVSEWLGVVVRNCLH